jgi:hypothetical protein
MGAGGRGGGVGWGGRGGAAEVCGREADGWWRDFAAKREIPRGCAWERANYKMQMQM